MRVFLRNQLLATFPSDGNWWNAAMFCAKCGEVWGKVDRGVEQWTVCNTRRERHGDAWRVGGSFLPDLLWPGSSGAGQVKWDVVAAMMKGNPLLAAHELNAHLAWEEERKETV